MTLVFGIVFSFLFPLPDDLDSWPLMVAVASAILRTLSITILLYTLKREEVSRVMPVVSTYPIFVAIMAIPLLGETLGYLHWTAIIVVVAGAVMVSVKRSPGGSTGWMGGTFLLLSGSSLLMAMADVASKYALGYISFSFWNMYWISILTTSIIFLLISLRPRVIRELRNIKRPASTLALLTINEALAMTGVAMMFWAMKLGPVSLVSAITSSRPIFVVIYALILTLMRPTFLLERRAGQGVLLLRLMAAAMIAGGIAIIYLA
jgi:drug/metabolite transporter (DMT)-like permease